MSRLDLSPLPTVLVRTDGTLAEANQPALDLLGEQAISRRLVDLVAPSARDRLPACPLDLVALVNGALPDTWSLRVRLADGSERDVRIHAVTSPDGDMVALAMDPAAPPLGAISENAFPRSHGHTDVGLLSRAVNAANNSIVIADLREPDAPLTYVNEGFLALTGYSRDEVIGRNCRFLQTRPDGTRDEQPETDAIAAAIAAGEPISGVVLRNYTRDGELFYNELFISPVTDADGEVTHMIGVQNDVTSRVLAQDDLRDRLENLRALFDAISVPVGLIEIRGDDVEHVMINDATARVFGFSDTRGPFGGPDAEAWTLASLAAAQSGTEQVLEVRSLRDRSMAVTFMVVRHDPDERVLRVMYIAEDVTEGQKLARALIDAGRRERERVAQDLHDSVGQALIGAGMIADHLRSSLGPDQAPLADEALRLRKLIERAVEDVRSITIGLDPLDIQEVGLRPALQRLCADIETLFEVECSATVPDVWHSVDHETATHLYRITHEAVSNAVRHGHATRVSICLDTPACPSALLIEDNGVGFDLDATRSPTGMGIATMRLRAHEIGGELHIGPRPEGGTRVLLHLAATD